MAILDNLFWDSPRQPWRRRSRVAELRLFRTIDNVTRDSAQVNELPRFLADSDLSLSLSLGLSSAARDLLITHCYSRFVREFSRRRSPSLSLSITPPSPPLSTTPLHHPSPVPLYTTPLPKELPSSCPKEIVSVFGLEDLSTGDLGLDIVHGL